MPENEQGSGAAQTGENTEGAGATTENTQQTIDWSKVKFEDVPEDLVKQTKLYKNTLTQAVERRQTIKQLKDQLASLEKGEGMTPEPQSQVTVPDQPTADPVLEELKKDFLKRQQRERVEAVAKKHNLPLEAWSNIVGTTDAELDASAANLAKFIVRPGTDTGNSGSDQRQTTMGQAILDKVKGGNDPMGTSPFDPGVQRTKGGGTL